jgi:hypothetical protein
MAGLNSGPRVGLAAFEPRLPARVEDWSENFARKNLLLGHDLSAVFTGLEAHFAPLGLAALGRAALRGPFLEPAVEDRDLPRAAVRNGELS